MLRFGCDVQSVISLKWSRILNSWPFESPWRMQVLWVFFFRVHSSPPGVSCVVIELMRGNLAEKEIFRRIAFDEFLFVWAVAKDESSTICILWKNKVTRRLEYVIVKKCRYVVKVSMIACLGVSSKGSESFKNTISDVSPDHMLFLIGASRRRPRALRHVTTSCVEQRKSRLWLPNSVVCSRWVFFLCFFIRGSEMSERYCRVNVVGLCVLVCWRKKISLVTTKQCCLIKRNLFPLFPDRLTQCEE